MGRRRLLAALGLAGLGALAVAWGTARRPTEVGDGAVGPRPEPAAPPPRLAGPPRDARVEEAPPAVLRGTVRVRGIGTTVSRGAVEALSAAGRAAGASIRDDGSYRLEVPAGARLVALTILPMAHSKAPAPSFVRTRIALDGTEVRGERVLDLEAEPGEVVRGVVVDAASGRPLGGARVLSRVGGWLVAATGTADDGAFVLTAVDRLGGPEDGWAEVRVFRAGYRERRCRVALGEGFPDPPGVTLALEPASTIRGVVSVAGAPPAWSSLVEATVPSAHDPGWGRGERILSLGATDGDGAFSLEGLPAADPVDVRAWSAAESGPGVGVGLGALLRGVGSRTEVRLEVPPAASAAVGAAYPGGVEVPGVHRAVPWRDADGAWWPAAYARERWEAAFGPPGGEVEVRVHAFRVRPDGTGERLSGTGRVTMPRTASAPSAEGPDVVVPVDTHPHAASPSGAARRDLQDLLAAQEPALWLGPPSALDARFHVRFEDLSTGAPVGPLPFELRESGARQGGTLPPASTAWVVLRLGRRRLTVEVQGYEDVTLVVDVEEPGDFERAVRLVPLRRVR